MRNLAGTTRSRRRLQASIVGCIGTFLLAGLLATGGIADSDVDAAEAAFAERQSGTQISGAGEVIRVLADDTRGLPHQRFVLRLGSGLSLLIAHNIELAPRLNGLSRGDYVRFSGQYEWNPQGGVVHWTHDDPRGRHARGWLEFKGTRYQ